MIVVTLETFCTIQTSEADVGDASYNLQNKTRKHSDYCFYFYQMTTHQFCSYLSKDRLFQYRKSPPRTCQTSQPPATPRPRWTAPIPRRAARASAPTPRAC
jgi:hypothetical protein